MAGFRQPEQPREQIVLWSERLDDALPADHPVRLLEELLRSRVFAKLFADWEGEYVLLEGQPPYHPRVLAGLYVFGMLNGLRSSRQLEAACWNRLDVRWLMSGQHPDHATIAAFVSRQRPRLRELKKAALEVGLRAGLAKLEHVAVDGTNIEADAGRKSVRSGEQIAAQLARLDEQIAALEAEWEANEQKEARLFGDHTPWAPAAEGTPPQRLTRMQRQRERWQAALTAIERRRAEAQAAGSEPPKAIASTSDPDGRVLRDKEGRRKPNYNAQLAVDAASGLILAEQVSDRAEDSGQLTPLLAQVRENCGRLPAEASADSGYNTGAELAELERQPGLSALLPEVHTQDGRQWTEDQQAALAAAQRGEPLSEAQWQALPRDREGRIRRAAFVYDEQKDEYRCPAGQALPLLRVQMEKSRGGPFERRQYRCGACMSCPQARMCCKNPQRGRSVNRDQFEPQRERMRARMQTPAAQERYRLRKQTVEPKFGYLKRVLGVRRFLRRGLANVSAEWTLICTAANIGLLLRRWEEVRAVL